MKTNRVCAILDNVTTLNELLPLTAHRPQATLPFDCKYRLIDFQLSNIVNANVHRLYMIFNVGETQSPFDPIGGGKEWNLDSLKNSFFTYLYPNELPKEALDENYFASMIDFLQKSKSSYAIIMTSRMLCNIDLKAVIKIHQLRKNNLTAVFKKTSSQNISEKDILLELNDENIVIGKTKGTHDLVSEENNNLCMDIFVADTNWLIEALKDAQQRQEPTNIIAFLRGQIQEVQASAYEYTGYLRNIFNIHSYYQSNMDMLDPAKFNSLLYTRQKIYTKLKNEVPTYYSKDSHVKNSHLATGCIIEGTVENSLVSRKTNVAKDAVIRNSIVMANAKIAPNTHIEYAILDKNVTIEPGIKIKGTKENPLIITKGLHVTTDLIGEDN